MKRALTAVILLFLVNYSQSQQLKQKNALKVTGVSDLIDAVGPNDLKDLLLGNHDDNVTKNVLKTFEKLKLDDATECVVDVLAFVFGLGRLDYWAIQLLDAQGKIRSGLTDGNVVWPGSYTVCKEVVQGPPFSPQFERPFRGKYCWALINVDTSWIQVPVKNLPIPPVRWGLCVPDTCSALDLKEFLTAVTDFKLIKKFANVSDIICLPDQSDFWNDKKSVTAFVICLVLGVIILLATTYDIYLKYHKIRYARFVSDANSSPDDEIMISANGDVLEYNDDSKEILEQEGEVIWQKIIFAFSMRRNFYKLFIYDKQKSRLRCLDGIRVLTLFWIIIAQTFVSGCLLADNLLTVANVLLSVVFELIAVAVLAADTFFILSGLLVSYLYFVHCGQNNGRMSWIKFYLYRYLRLTPLYILFIVVLDSSLIIYFGSGPFWPTNGFEGNNCQNNWWWNILYINNYTPSKYMCLQQSWYLANDMQFYIFSPVILILISRYLPFGLVVSGIFILISWFTSGLVSAHYKMEADINLLKLTPNTDPYFEAVDRFYYKPYLHIAPYVIGMLCGWLLYRTKFQQRLKEWMVCLGWILATAMALVLIFGMYKANDRISVEIAGLYHAFSRTAWSLVVCWTIFACSNGYGGIVNFILSLPFWQPLSRLSYCAFLIHALVINMVFDGSNVPVHFSYLFMLYYSAANICVIYLASMIISLIFEAPFLELLKLSPKYKSRLSAQ